jgi:transaldolase
VFAGRIADTGVDPIPIMRIASAIIHKHLHRTRLIWASPREVLNIFHAADADVDIITVSNDLLKKLHLIGKDLGEYSLDTVKMFYEDGVKAGFRL